MASAFAHAAVGYALSAFFSKKKQFTLILLAVISAILPDADVLAFYFGIPYEHIFGHRGFTHSIFFACIWALLLTRLFFKKQNPLIVFLVLFLSTISHALLDAMTNGGLGVAFFAPFENTRYFFSWRPIRVSPIGLGAFFTARGIGVLISEAWIIIASLSFILIIKFLKKYANKRSTTKG